MKTENTLAYFEKEKRSYKIDTVIRQGNLIKRYGTNIVSVPGPGKPR